MSKPVLLDYQNRQSPSLLTDVPGFGDPSHHGDDATVEKLLTHLMLPGHSNIHAIILVEKWGTTRFEEAHMKFLRALEYAFGDRMWNHIVIMLTHFDLIDSKGHN